MRSDTVSGHNGRAWRKDIGFSIVAKVATTVPAALVGLIATRQLTSTYGVVGFALFSLVLSIPTLLPFADFGLGGAVTQTVASRESLGADAVVDTIRRASIYLATIGVLIAAIGWAGAPTGVWTLALGISDSQISKAVAVVLSVFAATMPAVVGYRVLLGLQLNGISTLLQGISGILGSILVVAAAALQLDLWIVVAMPGLGGLSAAIAACIIARTRWRREKEALPAEAVDGAAKRVGLASMAWPLAIIAIAAPLTYQSDRIVLGNFSETAELAIYAAAFQLYGPANALVTTAGQTLWPRFSGLRAAGARDIMQTLLRSVMLFGSIGLALSVGLIFVGPALSDWSTNGLAGGGFLVFIAFGGLLFLNALSYPLGMYLMDPRGLRFQAICIATMAAVKIMMSFTLAERLGAIGPVIASIVALIVCVLVPCTLWVARSHRRERLERGVSGVVLGN